MSKDRFKHGRNCALGSMGNIFSPTLLNLINEPTPEAKKKERVRRGGKSLLTDDQVREARRLHEKECFTVVMAAKKFGVEVETMRRILNYITRAKAR